MKGPRPPDELMEQAALYALGALEGAERAEFEARVAEGCSLCEIVKDYKAVADRLSASVTPVAPPPALRQKLLSRIQEEAASGPSGAADRVEQAPAVPGFTFVHSNEGGWQEAGTGMWIKVLHADSGSERMTALVRMAPGSHYAPHRHASAEELFVLEGTCRCGGRLLRVGDYHRAEGNTVHRETSTQDGCVMLVIFSPNNEILEDVQA